MRSGEELDATQESWIDREFAEADANGDGALSMSEFAERFQRNRSNTVTSLTSLDGFNDDECVRAALCACIVRCGRVRNRA